MAFIKCVGDVKLEPPEIKCDPAIIRMRSSVLKIEPLIKPEPVEIGIDDILNSSDEDYIDNNNLRKDQKVLRHGMESKHNINLNETHVEGDKHPNADEDENQNCKDFNAVNNLASNEQLVVNYGKNFQNIENASRKFVSGDKIDWTQAYRTCETTNCEEDLKKVIVHRPIRKIKSIAPHEYTSLASNKVVCNHCHHACSTMKNLRAHIRRSHREGNPMYQCPYCPHKSKFQLRYHIILKHKDEMDIQWFECYKCNAKFKLKTKMAQHINNHRSMEELHDVLQSCPICEKKFRDIRTLERHKKFVHDKMPPKVNQCTECEYSSPNIALVRHHVEVHHRHLHQLSTHKCKDCDYKTKYQLRFKLHLKLHKKPLSCEKCGYVAIDFPKLKLHQMTHKKKINECELKYRCSKCDYKTYRQYSLNVHELNHLKPHEIEYFYCYHCNFKAKRKDNLKTHVLRHFKKDEINFQCFMCDFSTKNRNLLINHIKLHSKTKIKPQVSE